MTFKEFYDTLTYVDASRSSRLKYAGLVLDDLSLMPNLVELLFMVNDKVSYKAAWVFEYVCTENIYVIIPFLDEFTNNLKKVHFDSAKRPLAKVCEMVATANYSEQPNPINKMLLSKHKEHIIEACFDWMINDEKIAVKAYAMSTLYLFGQGYKWIHPELTELLEQDYPNQSAGFKARARHILKKIKR